MINKMDGKEFANLIDHTLLRPEATAGEVARLCREAVEYGFHAVCVNPFRVGTACRELAGSSVKVCSVVGFPLGASFCEIKAAEAARSVKDGAEEIDMVINIGALKDGDGEQVRNDIQAVVKAAEGSPVKVILETGLLTMKEKVLACHLAREAGAHYLKTSTGLGPGGATVEDVALLCREGGGLKVKAAGGIRSWQSALKLLEAGAVRLGTSSGVTILQQVKEESSRL